MLPDELIVENGERIGVRFRGREYRKPQALSAFAEWKAECMIDGEGQWHIVWFGAVGFVASSKEPVWVEVERDAVQG